MRYLLLCVVLIFVGCKPMSTPPQPVALTDTQTRNIRILEYYYPNSYKIKKNGYDYQYYIITSDFNIIDVDINSSVKEISSSAYIGKIPVEFLENGLQHVQSVSNSDIRTQPVDSTGRVIDTVFIDKD